MGNFCSSGRGGAGNQQGYGGYDNYPPGGGPGGPPMPGDGPGGGMPGEDDEAQPPASPSWKLPQFPAPALPPLTRNNKMVVACSRYLDDEEEKARLKRHVLNGHGDALSIVFDDPEATEMFVPEVKKLFSLALTLTSLEIHVAALEHEIDFLQRFLDTLPSHTELRAFSLVSARDAQIPFSAVSGFLYRNPGLQAIRIWGPDLTLPGSDNYYPQCKLLRADFSHCKIFPSQVDNILAGSKDTLLCLKFDKNVGLSGTQIAKAVNNYGQNVQMLSILLPAESESEFDQKASYMVADTASRFPSSLKFLHCAGLAASDNLFTLSPSNEPPKRGQIPPSHLSSLVALRLDNCPRLTVNGLFAAIRQRTLPRMVRLHAYWLENEEAETDVELWRSFAASQEIRIDTETPGLVCVTAYKESTTEPPPDPRDPSRTMIMPARPAPVAAVRAMGRPLYAQPHQQVIRTIYDGSLPGYGGYPKYSGSSRKSRRRRGSSRSDSSDPSDSDEDDESDTSPSSSSRSSDSSSSSENDSRSRRRGRRGTSTRKKVRRRRRRR